ncbi:DUF6790 family protein [Candidatus Margulisiibacteriota bacterium]
MYTVFFLALAIIAAGINLALTKKKRTTKLVIDTFLLYLFVIFVGLNGLLAFYGHAFMADQVAMKIGWQPGSPFQFEVAVSDLAFGVLGILCFWFRGNFWLATGIGNAIFLLGAAFGHIREMMKGNLAPYNTGAVLFVGDIFMPLLIITLLIVSRRLEKQ